MNIEKLQQLAEMHRRGELTDAEFTLAKQAILQAPPETSFNLPTPETLGESVREGVNAWIKYRIVMAVVGGILIVIMAIAMFSMVSSATSRMSGGPPVITPFSGPGHGVPSVIPSR